MPSHSNQTKSKRKKVLTSAGIGAGIGAILGICLVLAPALFWVLVLLLKTAGLGLSLLAAVIGLVTMGMGVIFLGAASSGDSGPNAGNIGAVAFCCMILGGLMLVPAGIYQLAGLESIKAFYDALLSPATNWFNLLGSTINQILATVGVGAGIVGGSTIVGGTVGATAGVCCNSSSLSNDIVDNDQSENITSTFTSVTNNLGGGSEKTQQPNENEIQQQGLVSSQGSNYGTSNPVSTNSANIELPNIELQNKTNTNTNISGSQFTPSK